MRIQLHPGKDGVTLQELKLDELMLLRDRCCKEIRCRATVASTADLAEIRGNEAAKRALLVAIAGGHSILFVGPHNSGKTMLVSIAAQHGITAFERLPCPCGRKDPRGQRPCSCPPPVILKHRSEFPKADIRIRTRVPTSVEMQGRLPGFTSADLEVALNGRAQFTELTLTDEAITLLRNATDSLRLDPDSNARVLAVARTIANLGNSVNIRSSHAGEAVHYRSLYDDDL